MTIYIDILILINAYICWLLISLTGRLIRVEISSSRTALCSLIGGISSLAVLADNKTLLGRLIITAVGAFSLAAIIAVAFYKRGVRIATLFTAGAEYIALNILLGGAAFCLKSISGSDKILVFGAYLYIEVSVVELIILTGIIYIILLAAGYIRSKRELALSCYHVFVEIEGRMYGFEGIADTGNNVRDVFTGRPVVVCTGVSPPSPDCTRLYPVPYNTVSGEGLLYAFKPDSVLIRSDRGERSQPSCLVAFKKEGAKRAIFNPSILKY